MGALTALMPESFGARLRQRREERQIDLLAIAAQTKIKLALLEALERDDVSQWPAGIFRRAYIRTYAHAIGLEPDTVLREFLEVHPEPADVASTATTAAAAAAEEASRRSAAPPTRLRTIVDSAIGSLARLRRPGTGDDFPPSGSSPGERAPGNERAAGAGSQAQPESRHADVPELDALDGDGAPEAVPPPGAGAASTDVAAESTPAGRANETDGVTGDGTASAEETVGEAAALESRLEEVAQVCTALGQADSRTDMQPLLGDLARVLDATGLIVWLWDEPPGELRPALVHGYSDRVVAHLPTVKRDADNATAAAFRAGTTCAVAATAQATAALAVPLLDPDGCSGVLAIELQQGIKPAGAVRAIALLLAAALAQVVSRSHSDGNSSAEAPLPAAETPGPPRPPLKVRR